MNKNKSKKTIDSGTVSGGNDFSEIKIGLYKFPVDRNWKFECFFSENG